MIDSEKLPVLKLVVVIVDWDGVDKLTDVLSELHIRLNFLCVGEGTANSEIADILGLGSAQKGVLLCVQPDFKLPIVMRTLSKRLKLNQQGKGIAFSVPLSGVVNPLAKLFHNEKMEVVHQMENEKSNIQHDLIISVVEQGFSTELMDKAKAAGARGGTIVNARHMGAKDAVKFFNISVQGEREIVAILTKREQKADIMRAINHYFGLATEAQGIIFSVPAEDVTGIDFDDTII